MKGEGAAYTEFLVKTLKPFIDSKYRTKKGRDYTFIAGSSMGALVSEYAILKYPDVFSAAGMFSPAFWIAPNLYTEAEKADTKLLSRFFFYAGSKESNTMVNDVNRMYDLIRKNDNHQYEVNRLINPFGRA